jgi:hypothetical protein
VDTFEREYEGDLVELTVGPDVVKATSGHPFWVVEGEGLAERPRAEHIPEVPVSARIPGRWVDAGDLQTGDVLHLQGSACATIDRKVRRHVCGTVCNFHVEELQCYAVGRSRILVHNNSAAEQPAPGGGFRDPKNPAQRTFWDMTPEPAPQATGAVQQTFRDLLTPGEQAEFEALRAQHPEWVPSEGLDAPATVRTVAENAEARAEFTGRGHHPHPLKFGGEPNPPDLLPTGETRTVKNPTHTEVTNFWNRVLRRINSQQRSQ